MTIEVMVNLVAESMAKATGKHKEMCLRLVEQERQFVVMAMMECPFKAGTPLQAGIWEGTVHQMELEGKNEDSATERT